MLVFFLFCSVAFGVTGAFADQITMEDKKICLQAKGLPDYYLDTLPDSEIDMLYEYSFNYSFDYFASTITMNESNEYEVQPFGHIKDDMFNLKTEYRTIKENNNEISWIDVRISYEWVKVPTHKKTDGVSINWDSNLFALKGNSFYAFDEISVEKFYWKKHTEHYAPDLAEQGGIGYTAQLGVHLPSGTPIYGMRGEAKFTLLPRYTIKQENSYTPNVKVTSFNVNYVHDRTPLFGSISFSVAGVGVAINAPTFNDYSSKTNNYYYL